MHLEDARSRSEGRVDQMEGTDVALLRLNKSDVFTGQQGGREEHRPRPMVWGSQTLLQRLVFIPSTIRSH